MSAFGGEDESDHLDVWEVSWDKGATHWLREKKVRGLPALLGSCRRRPHNLPRSMSVSQCICFAPNSCFLPVIGF